MKFRLIVLILTILIYSCAETNQKIVKVSINENISIADTIDNVEIEKIITPYRNKIKSLEQVIGFSEASYSIRDSELESTLGNLIADILYQECNYEFKKINSREIDFALFNYGGIRSTLNEGEITQHNLFTIMPWKNVATVVKIDGQKVIDLIDYIDSENLAHPSSKLNIKFFEDKTSEVYINGKKFNKEKDYYVLTSNFLQEGGDKMTFFSNPIELHSLELNLREVLISHIKNKKTIVSRVDNRIERIQ